MFYTLAPSHLKSTVKDKPPWISHSERTESTRSSPDSVMMLDLGPFSSENFDPKKWINSACQTRHPQDSLDKHMVDLEMKLQMLSEEIAASLEEQSAAALLRVPRGSRDVIRLRDDAVTLRSAVSGILQKIKKVCISSV